MNNQLLSRCALGLFLSLIAVSTEMEASTKIVTYEEFGAKGDGVTDDLPAIQKAHEHANQNGLPVRSKPGATYHLGTRGLTAVIATDTDWNTSKFIIDDSKGVENSSRSIFEVRSLLKPIPLEIKKLKKDQTRLDIRPPVDCLVYIENANRKLFIRKGGNQNSGTAQKEVFVLKRDGTIIGAIDWDYDVITKIEANPIDEKILTIKGGIFTNIANQGNPKETTGYWKRNISIRRSKTLIEGVTNQVTGEKEMGLPYAGFLNASTAAHIMFRNCVVDGRKVYQKAGKTGGMVPMGTYGYHANLIVDFRMVNCRMGNDIRDTSRWGVVASNFMKNFIVEDCVLSRVDVHMGVSGQYIIRRSTLGHAGLNAIGRGQLIVEDSNIQSNRLVNFRDDYGSTWDGDILIKNTSWTPRGGRDLTMFTMKNDGKHDFGYSCSMPRSIRIEGLKIESKIVKSIRYFDDPFGKKSNPPFPYRPTEKIEVSGLKTPNQLKPGISRNPALAESVKLIEKP
jgi:hypothetical protein